MQLNIWQLHTLPLYILQTTFGQSQGNGLYDVTIAALITSFCLQTNMYAAVCLLSAVPMLGPEGNLIYTRSGSLASSEHDYSGIGPPWANVFEPMNI